MSLERRNLIMFKHQRLHTLMVLGLNELNVCLYIEDPPVAIKFCLSVGGGTMLHCDAKNTEKI